LLAFLCEKYYNIVLSQNKTVMTIINKIAIPNNDLKSSIDHIKITCLDENSKDFLLNGVSISRGFNNYKTVIVNHDESTVAVICDYSTKNDCTFFTVHKFDNLLWLDNFVIDLTFCTIDTMGVINVFESAMNEIAEIYSSETVNDSSTPSAPNSSTCRASISGKLKVAKAFQSHGGYYGSNNYFHCGLQIGSGIKRSTIKEITSLASIYGHLATKMLTKIHVLKKEGTNFNTIGLAQSA
jgi:hypothetical protein